MSKNLAVPSEVYSRVVGYFRPVSQWNTGKREEYSDRKQINPHSKSITEISESVEVAETYLMG